MTQKEITRRIRKFQNAEASGKISTVEMEALMEGLAKELRKDNGIASLTPIAAKMTREGR